MSGEKKANAILRRERQLRGWSQQKIAELVGTSEDVVSRWERGERKPSPFFQEKLCVLFGKTAEELGFIQPCPIPLTSIIPQVTVINQSVDERLDQAESIINLAWEAWFASRPRQATKEVAKQLPALERMTFMPLATVHVLRTKELIVRSHGLLGASYIDALQKDLAFYHYNQAHNFAEELHDVNFAVSYLALMGDVLRRQNDKATALSYIENARDRAAHANPATRGYILQLLAYAYSDIGNEAAFDQAIAEATDLLAFAGEGKDAAKEEFTPFEIYEIRGKANRDLGKPLKALPFLELAEKSLHKAGPMTPRWHALLEISRGQAFCDSGDITTAVDVVSRGFLMAYRCHSPHQMNRVRKLLKKLENTPFKNHSEVQNLKNLLYETYMSMDNSEV